MRLRTDSLLRGCALGILAFTALALPAAAQEAVDTAAIRSRYLLDLPPDIGAIAAAASRASPGSSAGSPTAFGPGWGQGFVGAGYQYAVRYSGNDDGTLVAGFGLGNPQKYIGAEVAFTSFQTVRSGFLTSNGLSFKVHRNLPGNAAVAVGWESAFVFGDASDGGSSLYAVGSKMIRLGDGPYFQSVTVSAGVGDGRFRFEDDYLEDRETVNAFGSIGVQVIQPVALIADWTGQDLVLAASIVPFRGLPLTITPGFADVTGTAGDGARFTVGAGMGFQFAQLTNFLR